MSQTVPPSTLNFMRWTLALLILLPVAGWVLRPGSAMWSQWRRFALLGALGVGSYNALQYLALKTSTPLNVTLVAASMPLWMLLVGRLLYRVPVTPRAALGAACSLTGVAVVLSGGSLAQLLAVQFVPGDGWILLAALAYVAIFPSVLAYRFWGTGVARVGPAMASFFANLSPLFAALLSGALLGEWPLGYHALGFVCIVAGIAISTPRQPRG